MKYVRKGVAVTLSFLVFMMCFTPCGYAAAEKKGSKIEIRMTKEVPLPAETKTSTAQWFKDNKWWVALGVVLAGGIAAAAGGGGGGGSSSSGPTVGPVVTETETGSVTVGW